MLIPLTLAGYARYLKGIKDDGTPFEPSPDPMLAELQAIVAPLEIGKPGIALGVGLGYAVLYGQRDTLLYICLALTAAALLMYHFFTHQWFLAHKNR